MPYEGYTPGVDAGLKAWLAMRAQAHAAKLRGGSNLCRIKESPYKYYKNWINALYNMPGEKIEEILAASDRELLDIKLAEYVSDSIPDRPWTEQSQHSDADKYTHAMYSRTMFYLKELVEADPSCVHQLIGPHHRTLLQLACAAADYDKAIYLIKHGSSVNIKDVHGFTPLHLCVHPAEEFTMGGDIVEALLRRLANIDVVDNHGRTPLHYACIIQCASLVTLLTQRGADISVCDASNRVPWDYARQPDVILAIEQIGKKPSQRFEYMKLQARKVARQFISDIFSVVQPKCKVCKRTVTKCALRKQQDFQYWLMQHNRFEKEKLLIKYDDAINLMKQFQKLKIGEKLPDTTIISTPKKPEEKKSPKKKQEK